MDPTAALKRWRNALKDFDYDEAADAARDLRSWVSMGGFIPPGAKLTPMERDLLGLTRKRAKSRASSRNPRKCRGRGPEKKRILVCRGKRDNPRNPRRIGESDAAYAKRLEAEMRTVKRQMTKVATKMRKIAKPRKNPANPKRKTKWSLTAYNQGGSIVTRAQASCTKASAERQARAMVGKTLKGSRITKVVLDGPK